MALRYTVTVHRPTTDAGVPDLDSSTRLPQLSTDCRTEVWGGTYTIIYSITLPSRLLVFAIGNASKPGRSRTTASSHRVRDPRMERIPRARPEQFDISNPLQKNSDRTCMQVPSLMTLTPAC